MKLSRIGMLVFLALACPIASHARSGWEATTLFADGDCALAAGDPERAYKVFFDMLENHGTGWCLVCGYANGNDCVGMRSGIASMRGLVTASMAAGWFALAHQWALDMARCYPGDVAPFEEKARIGEYPDKSELGGHPGGPWGIALAVRALGPEQFELARRVLVEGLRNYGSCYDDRNETDHESYFERIMLKEAFRYLSTSGKSFPQRLQFYADLRSGVHHRHSEAGILLAAAYLEWLKGNSEATDKFLLELTGEVGDPVIMRFEMVSDPGEQAEALRELRKLPREAIKKKSVELRKPLCGPVPDYYLGTREFFAAVYGFDPCG